MSKLCVIYNMAAKYRAPIFRLMDKEFDIDWHYGHQIGDIKEMDASELKRVARTGRKSLGRSSGRQECFTCCGSLTMIRI